MVDDRVKRIHKLKDIIIKDEDKEYPATVTNFSIKGVSLRSEHILPTYKMIDLIMTIDGKVLNIKGSVRWIHEHKRENKAGFNKIGIAFLNPPKEYLEYIKKFIQ